MSRGQIEGYVEAIAMVDMPRNMRERAQAIREAIRDEEQRLRSRYRWLAYQDLLGLFCFAGCLAAMTVVVVFYLRGRLSGWMTVPLLALPLSILHELEHDLIHDQYFRRHRRIQNVMYFIIWILKQGLNPWYRREVHLKHHRVSGQKTDIEERLIGLGLPFGFMRIFVALHPLGSLFLFDRIKRESPDFRPFKLFFLSLPTYGPFLLLTYAAILYAGPGLIFGDPFVVLPEWGWPIVRDLSILVLLPNTLRQFCLVLMSTYSHYYEDIPKSEVYFQNQILRRWYLWPLQLFCCNFGSTHIIHHYVINQPFYLRQLVARAAHAVMAEHGVRVNDLGTVVRANRWSA